MQLTFVAPLPPSDGGAAEQASRWTVRPMADSDSDAVGRLYFAAYPPGVAGDTVDEAIADVRAAIAGEYGVMRVDASLVASDGVTLIGAVQVVDDPPWDDVPPGPFVIELFTDPAYRGRGIARDLITRSIAACASAGCRQIGLRVDSDNTPALALYRSLGFVERR